MQGVLATHEASRCAYSGRPGRGKVEITYLYYSPISKVFQDLRHALSRALMRGALLLVSLGERLAAEALWLEVGARP